MPKQKLKLTRSHFLKAIGAITLTPWLSIVSRHPKEPSKDPNSHKILSCNIRVALTRDAKKGVGWEDRKELCVQVIRSQNPDVICLQEVIRPQMADLEESFSSFGSFGFVGPVMDAYQQGYHGIAKNPILYSQERYELISTGCYWLSESPLQAGSISWGSGRPRHVNWIRLKDRNTQREFRVLNTHLDHVSQHARKQQAQMIIEESKQYQASFPQILAGDFNQDASDAVIDLIKEGGWIKNGEGWTDTYSSVHGPKDPGNTVHRFEGPDAKVSKGKVDFIFHHGKVKAKSAEIIKDNQDGLYPSDHYFVSANVEI